MFNSTVKNILNMQTPPFMSKELRTAIMKCSRLKNRFN